MSQSMPPEPHIVINGVTLSCGQSLSVRVAVSSFLMQLTPEEKAELGPVGQHYEDRLNEVFRFMMLNQPAREAPTREST